MDKVIHWENIYSTKKFEEVSWYQQIPQPSLGLIEVLSDKSQSIIDIGGGDSHLADHLLGLGYADITVLDISANAINRAKERLGEQAKKLSWVVSDITLFTPNRQYDIWHDRAVLHFLTDEKDVNTYAEIAKRAVKIGGHLIIGVFSANGPDKCSGIFIRKYDADSLCLLLKNGFEQIDIFTTNHITPTGSSQNFLFGIFKRVE